MDEFLFYLYYLFLFKKQNIFKRHDGGTNGQKGGAKKAGHSAVPFRSRKHPRVTGHGPWSGKCVVNRTLC